MTAIKNVLFIILILNFFGSNSQETIDRGDIFIQDELAYKFSDQKLFTGIAVDSYKNGHLIDEEEFENGIILSENKYFNFKEKKLFEKIIYNDEKPFVLKKKIQYHWNKKGTWNETFYYDLNGQKVREERMEDGILSYECDYTNGKKAGKELSYFKNGEIQYSCNYIDGKKDGQEYCVNKKGKIFIKNYSLGKRIK